MIVVVAGCSVLSALTGMVGEDVNDAVRTGAVLGSERAYKTM